MSASDCKILKTEPLDGTNAKWTRLILTTYSDPSGAVRTWEHAERPTRPANAAIDGVGIVAILKYKNKKTEEVTGSGRGEGGEAGPEIVLQKQFRPPVGKVVIEVPAGLVDERESAEEAAVRELREETGFVGVVEKSSSVMFNDPGFCNTNLKMVHVTVDMEDERNKHPKPQLEEGEFIETFTLPLMELWKACKEFEQEGYAIDARVATLAEGIELARQWNL